MAESSGFRADQNGVPENQITQFMVNTPNFLMVKKGDEYHALFTDGKSEHINPIDGTPRPDPDPAVRTKAYKVPTDLRDAGAPDEKAASRFTGLMRGVVGCYHSRKTNAPFKNTYTCTHGIVKKPTVVTTNGVAVAKDKYWVVEIRKKGSDGEGVYIAPVTFSGRCIGSWDITKYLPTPAQIQANPGLGAQGFSLAWAFGAAVQGVSKLVDIAMPDGAAWYDGYGWAFSSTGGEAQTVLFRKIAEDRNPPSVKVGESVLKTTRWKITFTKSGTEFKDATLTGAIAKMDDDKLVVFRINGKQRLWIPADTNGKYTCIYPTVKDNTAYDLNVVQDAPIHVHYAGEQEIVVRWKRSNLNESVPNGGVTKTPPFPYVVLGENRVIAAESSRLFTRDNGTVDLCHDGTVTTFRSGNAGGSFVQQRQLLLTAGFECSLYSGVSSIDRFDRSELIAVAGSGETEVVTTSHGLTTDCNAVEGTYLETITTTTTEYTHRATYQDESLVIPGDEPVAYLVLSAEDREGVLFIRQLRKRTRTGHWVMTAGGSADLGVGSESVQDFTGQPTGDTSITYTPHSTSGASASGLTYMSAGGSPGDTTVVIDTTDIINSGEAKVLLGDRVYEHALTYGPSPSFDITNPTLKGFSEVPTTGADPEYISTIKSMHGNMLAVDPNLKPPDQRGNSVRIIDNVPTYVGGFPDIEATAIIAFVGKS